MKKHLVFALAALTFATPACAAPSPLLDSLPTIGDVKIPRQGDPDWLFDVRLDNAAHVILFRGFSLTGIFNPMDFKIDGKDVASLGSDEYTEIELQPGHHDISMNEGTETLLMLEKGQTIYIEAGYKTGKTYFAGKHNVPVTSGKSNWNYVSKDYAVKEINGMDKIN